MFVVLKYAHIRIRKSDAPWTNSLSRSGPVMFRLFLMKSRKNFSRCGLDA
jgi:hypothetical protein